MRDFENFDLLIEPRDRNDYKVRLLSSPTGEGKAGFWPPWSGAELKEVLESFRDCKPVGRPQRNQTEKIGSKLFHALISGDIRGRWETSLERLRREGKGLRLRLRLDEVPELAGWPWEMLYDPVRRRFLSLSGETSVVRYLQLPTGAVLQKIPPPIKILVVRAHPKGVAPIQGEEEWGWLKQALGDLAVAEQVLLDRLDFATLPALQQAVTQGWHILHFIGHGRFDADSGQGALVLEDEQGRPRSVTGEKLSAILSGQKQLRLVVLNSCDGARSSDEDPFSGVAQALVGAGIPAVVAMRSRISDRAALLFADFFYKALAEEHPIDTALIGARRAIHAGSDDLEWSIPVLYMRSPDGRIIDLTEPLPPVADLKTNHRPGETWRPPPRAAMGLALLGFLTAGTYWASTLPDTHPDCPSPPGLDMPFARIEPGTFFMGAGGKRATVSTPFCMGIYEVTQKQWLRVMGKLPRQSQRGDDFPVANVSKDEAEEFIAVLNRREPGVRYRLPSEVQWEYAARAGTGGDYSFEGDESDFYHYGNCESLKKDDSFEKVAEVGSFEPNPWGLADIYGNVAEWVADTLLLPTTDPKAASPLQIRVIRRGGGFGNSPKNCNSVYRSDMNWNHKDPETGFRIVRDPL